MSIPVIK